ncbi:LysR family transcriptional regulator [Marinomonas sp. 15G1-11]|uniref:LysR family transcriptional regulator n=1 Tax=Marinomonas phaeophyticola TaxID=3004091 RepID=A0ABT4JQG5_9GAMM|nr:LysR family transcriptional regulator [Marinomonas sp. 15G1-11]MCZ2720625.1 LysR family transcriptional regulator [Marinomonas sp. 15G1-11]
MNTIAIKAFVTAAEENSFSLAAEKLHLTQPGISKRIQSLEDQLRCRLFDRIGRRIYLTEAGEVFLPHAYRLLQEARSGLTAVQNLSFVVAGQLSIATTQHIGLHHLAQPIRQYIANHPQVEFALDFINSKQAYGDVLQGKLELAIITEPSNIDEKLRFIPLWPEKLKFVCSKDHLLASHKRVSLASLSHFSGVLPGKSTYTRRLIDDLFNQEEVNLIASVPTNYLEAIKMLVAAGVGWSVLPENLIDDQLCILDIADAHIERSIGCLIHTERTLSNAAQVFLALLKEES